MSRVSRSALSTMSCKVTMAVTGLLLGAFALVHMVGNLKAFLGADDYNHYALWLRQAFVPLLPYEGLLWILRVVLLVALVAHVGCALLLRARARRARGSHRARRRGSWWGADRMLPTGVLLLAFVVFHLLDLTLGIAGPVDFRDPTPTESFAYQNLVASLGRPLAGAAYLAAMVALALHLAHGLWTTANDLGVTGRRSRRVWRIAAIVVALVTAIGNSTLPVAIWTGVLA